MSLTIRENCVKICASKATPVLLKQADTPSPESKLYSCADGVLLVPLRMFLRINVFKLGYDYVNVQ